MDTIKNESLDSILDFLKSLNESQQEMKESKSKEQRRSNRMDVIGQNGNTGDHYLGSGIDTSGVTGLKLTPDEVYKDPFDVTNDDVVNSPSHYTSHPSGVECIAITEHMSFCLGNAVKYIWRAYLK